VSDAVEQSAAELNEKGIIPVPTLKKHGGWHMTEADSGLTGKWTPWEADQRWVLSRSILKTVFVIAKGAYAYLSSLDVGAHDYVEQDYPT